MSKNAEGKSQRSFVVEDAIWHASLAATKASGTTVSSVIREALIAFNETNPVSAAIVKKTAAASRAKGEISERAKTTATKSAPRKAKAPTDAVMAKAIDEATAAKAKATAAAAAGKPTRARKTAAATMTNVVPLRGRKAATAK